MIVFFSDVNDTFKLYRVSPVKLMNNETAEEHIFSLCFYGSQV